ncbi:hypothetical protein BLA60_08635 [Actinophytocola xinjiangensis]|uniref:Enoyl-CoA hydratase/carnithine racemase n=1 Tax=Actinophytocola xinjiangensis TaxID=485602 RepID=A0A7Z0WP23_9PSEU|nr:enoyl-CoA hydratase/isomerase family protein [Actinophytocola xinjiangensis]OLF12078.1 hypothetical protein BLA60_08635 [Actinophytocola xinjiangensis]
MDISVRDEGPVRVVTLSGPGGVNVVTARAHDRLEEVLTAANQDDGVRVVVLTGTNRTFSVGADIGAFPPAPCDPTEFVARFLAVNALPERLTKPVLAVVHGAATAGGFELALACDWILAAPTARFSLPEARFGLVAGYAAARLAQSVGAHRARRLLLTGETLTATQAVEFGLPVTVTDDPLDAAIAMAAQICRSAPHAVRIIKQRSVAQAGATDPDLQVSLQAYAELWNLPETRSAIAAWRDTRGTN